MDSEKILFLSGVSLAVAVGLYVLWGPSATKKKKKSGIIGLVNLGHTCFLNTLLQALASCPTFISWLSWHASRDDKSKDDYLPEKRAFSGLAAAIYKVILVLNGSEVNEQSHDGAAYAPYCVLEALGKRGWAISPGEQDAHELFHALLSTMGEEIECNTSHRTPARLSDGSPSSLYAESHKPSLNDALLQSNNDAGLECILNSSENEITQNSLSLTNDHVHEMNLNSLLLKDNDTPIDGGGDNTELLVTKQLAPEAEEDVGIKIVLSESSKNLDSSSKEKLEVGENGDREKLTELLVKPLDSLAVYASSYPGSPNPSRSPVSVQSPTHSASPLGSPKKRARPHGRRVQFAFDWKQRVLRYSDGRYTSQQLDINAWDTTGGLVSSLSGSPFRGFLTSQLKCLRCGFKSPVRYDKFDSLSLSLPRRGQGVEMEFIGSDKKGITLEFLLHRFISKEIVEDVACESCTLKRNQDLGPPESLDDNVTSSPVKSTFLKWLNFGRLPKCLCFHIQRTTWFQNGQTLKRHDFVAFPEYLCMEMYTYLQASMRESKAFNLKSLKEENSPGSRLSKSQQSLVTDKINPKAPLSPPDLPKKTNLKMDFVAPSTSEGKLWHRPSIHRRNTFRLTAVVVHVGDSNSGHFITYRRGPPHPSSIKHNHQKGDPSFQRNGDLNYSFSRHSVDLDNSRWYYTSDTEVKECSLNKVLESVAYMLFYEKVLPSHG